MKKEKERRESEILAEICEWLCAQEYFFWRTNNMPVFGRNNAGKMTFRSMPKFSLKGVPDIILLYRGHFIGLEVKRPSGKLRPEQITFRERVIANGGNFFMVTSVEDTKKALDDKTYIYAK